MLLPGCYGIAMTTTSPRLANRVDAAIDLGTANTVVVDRTGAVLFDEPSFCCFDDETDTAALIAVGSEAKSYAGRTTGTMRVVQPLRNGVLCDLRAATELLRRATRNVRSGWSPRASRTLIGIPADATQAERSALSTAARDAGLAEPILLTEPILAAVGAGRDIDLARGCMVVDCGAGVTEVAVISLGALCTTTSARGGGDELDRLVADLVQLNHRFRIGANGAERLKLDLVAALAEGDEGRPLEVKGLHLPSGRPLFMTVAAAEFLPAWTQYADRVVKAVLASLSATPPELARDILDDGILLTGAASTETLARLIERATGVEVIQAERPGSSVVEGLASFCRPD